MPKKERRPEDFSIDPAAIEMLHLAAAQGIQTAFQRAEITAACPIGRRGNCCYNCFMGPCRFEGKTTVGICGATHATIQARNMVRSIAAGASAHSDHGRDMAFLLKAAADGTAPSYQIKDEQKLHEVAKYMGIATEGRAKESIALDVANEAIANFGRQEGELTYLRRAPQKRQELWRKLGIAPRGFDREVVEAFHRTGEGTDQDPEHILLHGLKVGLADGWGGSMLATDIGDILFGTPTPLITAANLGVLKEDEVNIVVHGHEPNLSEMIVVAANLPESLEYAREKGAKGINLAGICCTSNEVLMRQGVPSAGNMLHQELAVMTGAVDAMVVDVQCVMQALVPLSQRYHTKLITTSPKAKIAGAMHIQNDEHEALSVAKLIVRTAIDNFPNRGAVHIPDVKSELVAGFSHEYIRYMQGGTYRGSFVPLNENIINGRIRGAAGVVGCNNPRTTQDASIIHVVRELIKNDVLVVTTGCGAIACGKHGFLSPEIWDQAGAGLREVCEAIGIPPVLHMGSCVDNSRILTVLSEVVATGGLGEDISDLPAVGICPEWMHEKALSIGAYFVASGAYVIFGVDNPVEGHGEVYNLMTEGWERQVGGQLVFEPDPQKIVELALKHIDEKRQALKLEQYDPKRYQKSAAYVPGDIYPAEVFTSGARSAAVVK